VFVSLLIHELGHVFMGQVFGAYGHIVLYSFGGLAIGSSNLSGRWKRIAVSFAGPGAQFVLLGLIWLVTDFALPALSLSPGVKRFLDIVLFQLWSINLWWPILNLLPIWPLDGGRITREVLDWLMPQGGVRTSLGVSFVVAGLLAINSLVSVSRKDREPLIPY